MALTLLTAASLVIAGGVWWLIAPVQPGHGSGPDALAIVTPRTQQSPVRAAVSAAPKPMKSPDLAEATAGDLAPQCPTFNGRPLRVARKIRMLVTGYSPDARSCGIFADNITASGYSVWTNGMRLVAADKNVLPFGSLVSVPGYDDGHAVPVLDRGGAIKGNRLDLLFATHAQARQWGKKWVEVTVWEYAD